MSETKYLLKRLRGVIEKIRADINQLILNKKDEIKKLKNVESKYAEIDEVLKNYDLPITDETLSLFGAINSTTLSAAAHVGDLFKIAEHYDRVLSTLSSTASSSIIFLASNPSFEPYFAPDVIKSLKEDTVDSREDRQKKIISFLGKISQHLVKTYLGACENLETNVNDPNRGALGMIREVVNQSLDLLAPVENIKGQPWFKPDKNSKTGVTRKHRVKYIAEFKSKNKEMQDILIKNIDLFDEGIKSLNKFHDRKELTSKECKLSFYQAEHLLELLNDLVEV